MSANDKGEAKTLVMENTHRRDVLIENEKKFQKQWADEKIFEVDAPQDDTLSGEELREKYGKFFATMAYPYMNGVLHAGHGFTLSKVEYATGYERMIGKKALFPLGFHCTGMPIKACADKLIREIEQFGQNFDQNVPADEEEVEEEKPKTKEDLTKFTTKKSKAAAKQGRGKYQFEIMMQLGIDRSEVHKFADPYYWLDYFPPLCKQDCNSFGARIDWRRSFITTDKNPYYDAFVRWQMNRLKESGKIKFGERYTIYSAKDGQPCMDHDRQSGEAVNPQEYTGIKMKVTEWIDSAKDVIEANGLVGKNVYMVAATLRPETMYGQTCCFVSPKIDYGVFDAGNGEFYITTERAFKNMSFQNLTPKRGDYTPICKINGAKLIGTKVKAPLCVYDEIRVLPMETILEKKGTGVVTSVPSDSPDDYVTSLELQNKADYYKIQKEWASLEPVELIETPTYGKLTAKTLVEELKIKSPKDKDNLAKAKEAAYKEGFFMGTMLIGKYKGEKVEVAKPKVRDDLVASGEAFVYSEPESLVISRSGDECVVSLEDQWYMDYGEPEWRAQTEECLKNLNTYSNETRHGFEKVLGWLRNWALSRSYGLGTKIPWDPKYLVESLSDSTIYMAYYTICHMLHSDFNGQQVGTLGIKPEDMTDEVWDYVFHHTDKAPSCTISTENLNKMRREFAFFYPLDVRISGKDLIPNHLTFFLYCHVALFPKQFWPRGIRANGHLMLNNEKMSKSTGNFLTMKQAVEKFGADATRITLADAGDTFEDANFDEANANATILRLFNLKEWIEEVTAPDAKLRTGEKDSIFDQMFENEMNHLIEITKDAYDTAFYKNALKFGLFDFQTSRDYYREATQSLGIGMHKDLIMSYIKVQALLLCPVAPHFAEFVWRDVLGNTATVHDAKFPVPSKPVDKALTDALAYTRDVARKVREVEGLNMKKKKKGPVFDAKAPSKLSLYVTPTFPDWQDEYIEMVREQFSNVSLDITPDLKQKIGKTGNVARGMKFVNHLKQRIVNGESPSRVFNRQLSFDELETIKKVAQIFEKSAAGTNVTKFEVVVLSDDRTSGKLLDSDEQVDLSGVAVKVIQDAVPGSPGIELTNL